MDSVTQIALGAALGEAVLGRKIGAKAALTGAICATLPDLDSFIPYADAVATMTFHRSFSHSLLVLTALSPLLAWLITKLLPQVQASFKQWWWLVFLSMFTHPILDFFTVYGTQLFWPVYDYPFSGSTVFIVDPAYTLPLGLGVLCALFMQRSSRKRLVFNMLGLTLSCCYLLWTVIAKFHIEARIKEELVAQQIQWTSLLSTPAPLNSILWRLVIMREGGYYEAYYSVLDAPHHVEFTFHPDEKELLEPLAEHWPVQRLQWFTHGFYSVHRAGDNLLMSDLRMGQEPVYLFTFRVAEYEGDKLLPLNSTSYSAGGANQMKQLQEMFRRTMTPIR